MRRNHKSCLQLWFSSNLMPRDRTSHRLRIRAGGIELANHQNTESVCIVCIPKFTVIHTKKYSASCHKVPMKTILFEYVVVIQCQPSLPADNVNVLWKRLSRRPWRSWGWIHLGIYYWSAADYSVSLMFNHTIFSSSSAVCEWNGKETKGMAAWGCVEHNSEVRV